MKKAFKKYVWLFEWLAAAFIIAVGTIGVFVNEIILAFTGIALIMLTIFRIFPLIKTTRDKLMRWILFIELLLNAILGSFMLYLVFSNSKIELQEWYGYTLGGILYVRAVIFFYETSLRKVTSDIPKFIAHIIFITVGTYIIAVKGFNESTLAWIIFAVALAAAGYIIIDGIKNYRNYRREFAAEEATKDIKKEITEEDVLELPANHNNINIPNEKDESEKKDEAVVQ